MRERANLSCIRYTYKFRRRHKHDSFYTSPYSFFFFFPALNLIHYTQLFRFLNAGPQLDNRVRQQKLTIPKRLYIVSFKISPTYLLLHSRNAQKRNYTSKYYLFEIRTRNNNQISRPNVVPFRVVYDSLISTPPPFPTSFSGSLRATINIYIVVLSSVFRPLSFSMRITLFILILRCTLNIFLTGSFFRVVNFAPNS